MTAYDERSSIMKLADEVHAFKREMMAHFKPIDDLICALVARADQLLPAASGEVESGVVRPTRERQRAVELKPSALAAAIEKDMAEEARPRRRRMKPLSEEQKQKRRESLVKARAARKAKGK